MTVPFLYIASLSCIFVTFLCWLWVRHPYTEEQCQKIVYSHLRVVRIIHLLDQFFYVLILGLCLVKQEQAIWISLISSLPTTFIFVVFWIFLRTKMKLVKGRLGSPLY